MPKSASRPRTLAWLIDRSTWSENFPTTELKAAIGNEEIDKIASLDIAELADLIESTEGVGDLTQLIAWAGAIHKAVGEAGLRTQVAATSPNATATTQVFRLEAPKPLAEMGLRELLEAWRDGLAAGEVIRHIRALPETARVEARTLNWVVVDPGNPEQLNVELTLEYFELLLDPASRVRPDDLYQSGDTLRWLRTLDRALGAERLVYAYPFDKSGITKIVGPDDFGYDWETLDPAKHCAMVYARQTQPPWLVSAIEGDRLQELTEAIFHGTGPFIKNVERAYRVYQDAVDRGTTVARHWTGAMEVRAPFGGAGAHPA